MVTGQEIEVLCYISGFLHHVASFSWLRYSHDVFIEYWWKIQHHGKDFSYSKIWGCFLWICHYHFSLNCQVFLLSFINIWLSCYQFLFIWILTRVVNFLSWMSEFSNCQLELRLSTGIYQKMRFCGILWLFLRYNLSFLTVLK